MVRKIIFAVIAAISIVAGVSIVLVTPIGSTVEPVVPAQVTNMSTLIATMVAENVPLQMDNGGVVVGILSQPFFSVDAQVLNAYGEDIQVFEYDSTDDALTDIDESGLTPEGQFQSARGAIMVTWIDTAHFHQTGHLIVLYVGSNSDITTMLEDLLGPQIAEGIGAGR